MTDLIERAKVLALAGDFSPDDLGGDIGTMSLRNPDGPELLSIVQSLSERIAVLEGALAALRPTVDEQEGRKAPTEAHVGCEHCEIEVTVPVDQENCPLCGWPLWETDARASLIKEGSRA